MPFLDGAKSEILIPVVAIIGGLIVAVIVVAITAVKDYFRLRHRDELDYDLKREMIDRGMSADEIERVIRASSNKSNVIPDLLQGLRCSTEKNNAYAANATTQASS